MRLPRESEILSSSVCPSRRRGFQEYHKAQTKVARPPTKLTFAVISESEMKANMDFSHSLESLLENIKHFFDCVSSPTIIAVGLFLSYI